MITMNDYCRREFGEKLYKLSLNGGMTCPNRDGTCGTGGCIFCSAGGSGEFTPSAELPMEEQIEEAKKKVSAKFKGSRYIAYFQAYTNTYAPVSYLESLYLPVVQREDIAVLSIATRPDCLGPEVLELLERLNRIKPVWVELGLQTIHPETAAFIRRGYPLEVYDAAVHALKKIGIHVITHVILGLPGEGREEMLATVRHIGAVGSDGIKLQQLYLTEDSDLGHLYIDGKVKYFADVQPNDDGVQIKRFTLKSYVNMVCDCVSVLPETMVFHRLTGDGAKKTLIEPKWSGDKKRVLNALRRELRMRGIS